MKWISTDSKGHACAWDSKPTMLNDGWNSHITEIISIVIQDPFKGNWQESLEERPQDV